MLRKPRQLGLLATLLLLSVAGLSRADLTANIDFCVTVASLLSLDPPAPPAVIVHDGTANDVNFTATVWPVLANDLLGSTVTFETTTAFTNTTSPTHKRDIELGLSLVSATPGSGWNVTAATDITDYANSDEGCLVSAESSALGNCVLSLDVTFKTGDPATLAPGLYCATVNATIAAN